MPPDPVSPPRYRQPGYPAKDGMEGEVAVGSVVARFDPFEVTGVWETIWLSFWFAQPEKFKKVACSEVPIVGYPAFAGGTYPVG